MALTICALRRGALFCILSQLTSSASGHLESLMDGPIDHSNTAQHVAFAGSLARWIERAGVDDGESRADLAVGMADVLNAATRAAQELEAMLQLDPQKPDGADQALTHLG